MKQKSIFNEVIRNSFSLILFILTFSILKPYDSAYAFYNKNAARHRLGATF